MLRRYCEVYSSPCEFCAASWCEQRARLEAAGKVEVKQLLFSLWMLASHNHQTFDCLRPLEPLTTIGGRASP